MDELLSSLREAGTLDSEGRFTLDWEQARVKIGKFQLSGASAALLRLVQAGVRSGARELLMEANAYRHLYLFEYARAHGWTTEGVLSALTNPMGTHAPGLEHLAIAVNALITSGECRQLRLRTTGLRLAWTPDGGIGAEAEAGTPELELEALFARPDDRYTHALTAGALSYAPLPVVINQRLINRLMIDLLGTHKKRWWYGGEGRWPSSSAEWFLAAPAYSPEGVLAPLDTPCRRKRWVKVPSLLEPPPEGVAAPGERLQVAVHPQVPRLAACHAFLLRTSKPHSTAVFVRDGVVVDRERNLFDRPGLVAVISARDLRSDLSGQVVHDADFRKVIQNLRQGCLWMYS